MSRADVGARPHSTEAAVKAAETGDEHDPSAVAITEAATEQQQG